MSRKPTLFFTWDSVTGALSSERSPESQGHEVPATLILAPGVIPALRLLQGVGFRLVALGKASGGVAPLLRSQGIAWDEPFSDTDQKTPGLDPLTPSLFRWIQQELAEPSIDLQRSALVGQSSLALQLVQLLRLRTFLLASSASPGDSGQEPAELQQETRQIHPTPSQDAEHLHSPWSEAASSAWMQMASQLARRERVADVTRKTKETAVAIKVDLEDSPGGRSIQTGIGFFDHMLEQIALHGGFSLSVKATGDLHIDDHHLVEDVALSLGTALNQALGDRQGIERYGFLLPMDEALAFGALDLSGRPYFTFQGYERFQNPFAPLNPCSTETPAEIPTQGSRRPSTMNVSPLGEAVHRAFNFEMIPHFFFSLCQTLGATLHLGVRGHNQHHKIEAVFKCFGRLLGQAIRWHLPQKHWLWPKDLPAFDASPTAWRHLMDELGMGHQSPSSKGALGLELGKTGKNNNESLTLATNTSNPAKSSSSPSGD